MTSADETPKQVRLGPDLNDDLHPQIPHDHIESQVQTGEVTWNEKGENIARLAEHGPESASEKRSLSRIPMQKRSNSSPKKT